MNTKPDYKVLYNQDCTDPFRNTTEPITPGHVELTVDEVAAGAPDVLLVNPNAQLTDYPSKVWQTFWDGYAEGGRSFFGNVPDNTLAVRERTIRQMAHLAEQCDYLATALASCRRHGIAPGISMRMNDMHDIPWPDSHNHSRFYRQHPQFHLKPVNARDWGSEALNYEHAEVREHYLALIREWVNDYDFDVLELDFSRFTYYFNRGYEMLRGFAAGYLAAGADGVELFNYFLLRKSRPVLSAEVFFGGLREIRSLEQIRAKPRTHLLGASYHTVEFDLPDQAPVTIGKNAERRFHMLLAAVPESLSVTVLVCFDGENQAEDLWLRLGRHDAGHATEVRPGPEGNPDDPGREWLYDGDVTKSCRKSKIAVFSVPGCAIRDGKNELVVRSENVSTTVLGIDVEIC